MIGEVIKEYLVSLGVQIDKPGFNQMKTTLDQTSGVVSSATSGWAKNFVSAGTIITTALASVTASIFGVMTAAAKQDLAIEKYSRSMLVSKSAALEMKTAIDALGESVQDIQLTPELMNRYRSLVADGRNMRVGGDYEGTMKNFRDLLFEFTRLKQEASYALQWVGYYLMKYLSRPLADAKESFRNFNDNLIKNMPVWTEKVARAIMYVINIGKHFIDLLKSIGKAIYDVWDAFPRGVKIATAALAGFFLLLKSMRLHPFITALGTLLLLADDYFGYMEGKQAAMGPIWDKLNTYMDIAKQKMTEWGEKLAPVWDSFVGYVGTAKDEVVTLAGEFSDWIQEVGQSKELAEFVAVMKELGTAFYDLGSGIVDLVTAAFRDLLDSLKKHDMATKFSDLMERLKNILWALLGALAGCIETLGQWFSEMARSDEMRDLIDAVAELFGALMDLLNALIDVVTVIASAFFGELGKTQKVYTFRDAVRAVVGVITSMIRVVSWVIELLAKFFKMMSGDERFKMREFWQGLARAVKGFADVVFNAIAAVGKLGQALLALVRGDYKQAMKLAGDALFGRANAEGSKRKTRAGINTFDDFMNAVAGQESGGNYSAVGGIAVNGERAQGKFQIMPSNWPNWAEEAGLERDAPRTPENQEIVARYKLGQYYDELGPEGALVAWYAGYQNGVRWRDGNPDAIGEGGHYSWDAPQAGGAPSIRQYVEESLGRLPDASNDADNALPNYRNAEIDTSDQYSIQNAPDDMRDPSWVDKARGYWRKLLSVRPTLALSNGFANADPMVLNGLLQGGYPTYSQGYGGNITNITYQVDVGGVNVAKSNASADDIGTAVGEKTASSINDRAVYVLQNRTLNGVQQM